MTDKKIKLLIVDDEVKFLESIAKRLEGIGAELKIAKKHDTDRLQILAKEREDLAQARKAD